MPKTIKSHRGTDNGNYKHGGKGTKLYEVWCSMRARCNSISSNAYKYYGKRVVFISDRTNKKEKAEKALKDMRKEDEGK